MKKIMILFVFVAAAAMTLASCQKNEVKPATPQDVEYTFLLGSEDDVDSKATIGENNVVWEPGDRLGTFTTSSTPTVNGYSTITPGTPASISVYAYGGLAVGNMLYFYYPYNEDAGTDKTAVTLSIPEEQDGKDDMPMASLPFEVTEKSTENQTPYAGQINLVNLAAIAEFNVFSSVADYQSELVESVEFTVDGETALAGSFTFDLTAVDYSDKSTLVIEGYAEKSVVASITPATVGASSDDAAKVNMVVAPGTYTGTVVVETDKASYTFSVTNAKEFVRSAVKPLAVDLAKGDRVEKTVEPEPDNVEYTIQWTSNSEWTASYTKLVSGDYTVTTAKNTGSTEPTVNPSANDCRVYAKGSITVANSSASITKLVFNISAQGKKRLPEITSSVGVVTIDNTNYKVVWEGTASSVTFTVGDKAIYGTDGSDKAGQLCFDSIDAISGNTGDDGGETPTTQPRNLAFSVTNVSAVIGPSFTKPVLSGATSGVTYSSSNVNVATVDESTGDVTLVGIGTTIIKALAPANEEYEAGEASYTLTVSPADVLVEDGTYVIAVKENGAYYAASIDSNGDRRAFVELNEYSSGSYVSHNSKIVWTITNVAGGIRVNMGDDYWGAKKNGVSLVDSGSAVTVSISKSGDTYYLWADCGSDGTRYLSKNADFGFGFYADSNKEQIYIIPATFVELPDLEKPVVNTKLNETEDGINVSWNAVANAQKYVVTCGNNSKEVTTTECEFTELSPGTYSITVTAMAEGYNSSKSESVSETIPSVGGGESSGKEVTVTLTLNAATTGSSSTSYVKNATNFTYDGISYVVANWNPSSLQIRGNKSPSGGNLQKADGEDRNFMLRNTTPIPGRIKSIRITYTAGTIVDSKTYAAVGASEITNQTTSGSIAATAETKAVSWTFADGGSYFAIGMVSGGTSGTTKAGTVTITYQAD